MPKTYGNAEKDRLLGMSYGTAYGRLKKSILFYLVEKCEMNNCFVCGEKIIDIDEFSIEHKSSWQKSKNPKESFFDLDNISFSHLRCNIARVGASITHCPQGHEYTEENTVRYNGSGRMCLQCRSNNRRQYRKNHPEEDTSAHRRKKGWR